MLAVKGKAAQEVLRLAGAENIGHKPVIDATNPIQDAPPVNGALGFFTTHDESLMEQLQREFKDAYFVKSFNSVGSASMVKSSVPRRQTHHVYVRQLRARQADSQHNLRPVRLGSSSYGWR